MKERLPFEPSDHLMQITGLALTDKQMEEQRERQNKILYPEKEKRIFKPVDRPCKENKLGLS